MGFVITGTNFVPIISTVMVGNLPATILNSTDTSLTVQVPIGAPLGVSQVVVNNIGLPPSNAVPFTVTQTFGCAVQ